MNPALAVATALAVLLPALGMRRWSQRRSCDALEVAVATACGPVAAVPLLWVAATQLRIGAGAALIAGTLAAALMWLACSAPTIAPRSPRPGAVRALVFTTVAWLVLCALVFVPYGLARPDGVHRMAMSDWQKHLMLATEMTVHDEFPPANPFLRGAGPSPYYHGFHLLAANLARAAGGESAIYASLLALMLFSAALVPLTVYVVARGMFDWPGVARTAALGATLLAGFDLLVLLLHMAVNALTVWGGEWTLSGIRELVPSTHLDYWLHHNQRQFSAPYLAAVWAPQHVLAACAGVLGFHWLSRPTVGGENRLDAIPAAMLLAATPMLSAYVGLAVASGLTVAFVVATTPAERRRWLATGAVASLLALPFLRLGASASSGLALAPSAAGSWRNGALFATLFGDGLVPRLLDTPSVYVFDFGILGVLAGLGVMALRGAPQRAHRTRGLVMAATILILAALVRPPVGGPNNLYARGLLPAWLLLAPFAAAEWQRRRNVAWRVAAGVCLCGTLYAAMGTFLEGYLFWASPTAAVQTARAVNERSSPNDIVAMPAKQLPGHAYWLRRSVVLYDERHARLFGASAEQVAETEIALQQALAAQPPSNAARQFEALGASIVLLPATSAVRSWERSPCFTEIHRDSEWLAVRVNGACQDD